jgi:hypothetical protein
VKYFGIPTIKKFLIYICEILRKIIIFINSFKSIRFFCSHSGQSSDTWKYMKLLIYTIQLHNAPLTMGFPVFFETPLEPVLRTFNFDFFFHWTSIFQDWFQISSTIIFILSFTHILHHNMLSYWQTFPHTWCQKQTNRSNIIKKLSFFNVTWIVIFRKPFIALLFNIFQKFVSIVFENYILNDCEHN